MRTFTQFITEGIKQSAYWYNCNTRKLHAISSYGSTKIHDTTDWDGHNAWSSVPGHVSKVGLTAEEGKVLQIVRDNDDAWEEHEVAFRKATEKLWQNNVRVLVAYYKHGTHINMQTWSINTPKYLAAAKHILDLLTHHDQFTIESEVYHANYHDTDDYGTSVEDVYKSHTIAELKARGKRQF